MDRGVTGEYETRNIGGEQVRAFIPKDLPPDPPLVFDGRLQQLLEDAYIAIGRLDGVSARLPDKSLFLYTYVRKEAVLSSQIEGTQSSFSDLLLHEHDQEPGVPLRDAAEVLRYVRAMGHGLERLNSDFPLCNRLIREIHGILLASGRGQHQTPGEFRRSQNWIGGSRPGQAGFVPPPPQEVENCMAALEKFLHAKEDGLPTLVRAGLAHVQFETIHPFLDGNGRVGRMLIALLLCDSGILSDPMLYLSLHLKQNRSKYYALLDGVRATGNWEDWLAFFLEGVTATAAHSVTTIERLTALFDSHQDQIRSTGRSANSALRAHQALMESPITPIAEIAERSGLSFPTASNAVKKLLHLDIAQEITGQKRNRLFAYRGYIEILNEDT